MVFLSLSANESFCFSLLLLDYDAVLARVSVVTFDEVIGFASIVKSNVQFFFSCSHNIAYRVRVVCSACAKVVIQSHLYFGVHIIGP